MKLLRWFLFFAVLGVVIAYYLVTKQKMQSVYNSIIPVESNHSAAISESNLSIEEKHDPLLESVQLHWKGDLDGMIERRKIRVLVVASEIMYHMDKGKKSGVVYELMKAFEKKINNDFPHKKKHIKTRVIFIPVSRAELIPELMIGRGDIAVADIAITEKRKKMIDFSEPFIDNIKTIIVSGHNSPKIESLDDLSGKDIFVRASSSHREYLESLNRSLTSKGLYPIKIKFAPDHLEDEDLLEMVNADLLDFAIVDGYKAEHWAKYLPNIVLHPNIVIEENVKFAWMIRKKSPKLLKEINSFILENQEGSRLNNILMDRYIFKEKMVSKATSEENIEKFKHLLGYFEKYSKQYNLNDRMMIAQGYQESKLDQKARSHVGAVGIMQLMPATGKDMVSGSIKDLESNIHAGIKYHRWLIDHYFDDESIDPLNRALFTFAAYNAGPGRIKKLRKIAKKRGYDPYVWFDNVEYIAAEEIGSETVTYVSNIYKYYIAYSLYKEHHKARDKAKETMSSRQASEREK